MKKYILKYSDIHKGNLILVNKEYKINKEINSNNLVSFSNNYTDILLDESANKFLQLALKEINSLNQIIPVSGYRSLKEQEEIYFSSLKENGEDFTKKYVALPNSSEHQTGLAIDLGFNVGKIDFIRPSFPNNSICNNFRKTSLNYGFIERYESEKEKITGISKEEWHFRYVGYPHSVIMKEKNLCLEEYINYLKQYEKNSLKYKNYEISYIPYNNKDIEITIDNATVSGNNVDGFIITRNTHEK